MLISGKEIMQHAYENGYAIPAFNFANMENLQAIIQGAEEMNSPVIIQTSQGAIDYAGAEYLADIGLGAAHRANIPVVLHLDHGQKYEYCLKAIRLGWTSVMIDASQDTFSENVSKVKEIVKVARPLDIYVEAEIGIIGGKEDDLVSDKEIYTEVKDAVNFQRETMCDSLAIAVGTAHGVYKGEVKIDFTRIKEIRALLPVPLVLHGSSGVPLDMVTKAVHSGITKVNFDTELKLANLDALQRFLKENPGVYDIRKMFKPCRLAMKEVVKAKIAACMSTDKSWIIS
ncbi:ketose-bisphosphate aldolase [Pelosinus sp. sgz500959]|uniref:class II fructose-bisphosphate aldolase n=1 Tax=Pelosinus sp. sgz500959 TaxID=3242472 RepID=UPI00366D0683